MTRKEQFVLLILAGAISLGSLVLYFHRREAIPDTPDTSLEDPMPASTPAAPTLDPPPSKSTTPDRVEPTPQVTVSIVGSVEKPGVYTLDDGARVQDLLEKAAGAKKNANLSDINLAARLVDGTTLSIPETPVWDPKTRQYVYTSAEGPTPVNPPQYTRSGWAAAQNTPLVNPSSQSLSSNSAITSALINLNTATQEQLESLPGIGSKLAQQIILYRTHTPFRAVEDLENVSGIGAKRFEQVRALVTVQ